MEIVEIYTDSAETSRQKSLDSNVPCDLCIKNTEDITIAFRTIADYLCFKCKLYLCAKCYIEGHAKHSYVCAVGVTKETEEKIEGFVDKLLKEKSMLRRKKIKREKYNPSVVDYVKVKHQLDEETCYITGLCGLKSGRWVVSDLINKSIKLIKPGSNVIERYISLSDRPFDITEIEVNQTHTDLDSATSMTSSEAEETQMGMETLLAVTVPSMRSIVYINLNETLATMVKCVSTDGRCYGIEFCDDRVYTYEVSDTMCQCVSILSIDGTVLKRVECMQTLNVYACKYLAVLSPEKSYVTVRRRDTVICMNNKGVITSRITMSGFHTSGISAGNDENIYVSSWRKNSVYRMDAELKQYIPVIDKTNSRYMKDSNLLCCFRDKLYISHRRMPLGFSNFVTIVRLYT